MLIQKTAGTFDCPACPIDQFWKVQSKYACTPARHYGLEPRLVGTPQPVMHCQGHIIKPLLLKSFSHIFVVCFCFAFSSPPSDISGHAFLYEYRSYQYTLSLSSTFSHEVLKHSVSIFTTRVCAFWWGKHTN